MNANQSRFVHDNEDLEGQPPDGDADLGRASRMLEATWSIRCWPWGSANDESAPGGYDVFLTFTSPDFQSVAVHEAFMTFKSSGMNVPMMILTLLVALSYLLCRGSFDYLWYYQDPLFYLGFFSGLWFSFSICAMLVYRLTCISNQYEILWLLEPYRKAALSFGRTRWVNVLHDCVLYLLIFTGGFYLLARSLKGQCAPDTTIWETQRCNPMAPVRMIPVEQGWVVLLTIPMFQIFVKGASHRAVFIAWVLSIAASNLSMYLVNAQEYFIWLNFAYIVVICISYEMERTILVSFINLSLFRRVHDEGLRLQSQLSDADLTKRGLMSNLKMITCVSDEVRAALDGVRCNVETIQSKLRQPTDTGPKNPARVAECVAIASIALEGVSMMMKVLDDLSILERIVQSDQGHHHASPRQQKKAVGFIYHGGTKQWRHSTHTYVNAQEVGPYGQQELGPYGQFGGGSQLEADAGDDEEYSATNPHDDPELTTIHSHSQSSRNKQPRSLPSDSEEETTTTQLVAAFQDEDTEEEGDAFGDPRAVGVKKRSTKRPGSSTRPWIKMASSSSDNSVSMKSTEEVGICPFIRSRDGAYTTASEACAIEHTNGTRSNNSNTTVVPHARLPVVRVTTITKVTDITNIGAPSKARGLSTRSPVLGIIGEFSSLPQNSPLGSARQLLQSPVSAFVSRGGHSVELADNARRYPCVESLAIEVDIDSRVLSDEDAAALPSPVAVMFPFAPDNDQNGDDDSSSAPDSLTMDDNELSSYISKLANTIATELKTLTRSERAAKSSNLELTPLQLLMRMPVQGAHNRTSQFCLLEPSNARVMDIVEKVSTPKSSRTPRHAGRCAVYDGASSSSLPPTVYLRSIVIAVQNQFRPVETPPMCCRCDEFVSSIRPKTTDRLNTYVHELTLAMYRDLRSTCDIFELLISNLNDDWGQGPYALLEDQHRLTFLQEYLSVIRVLMVQSSASLLATIDNVSAIRTAADSYQKMMMKKK